MPKRVVVEMEVPSNSRPDSLRAWLSKQLNPHRMTVLSVREEVDVETNPKTRQE